MILKAGQNRIGFKTGTILVLLLGIPFFFASVYFHELSHKADYRNIDIVKDELCVLNCGDLGYYEFTYKNYEQDKIDKINKWTEIKAYIVSILYKLCYVLIVFLIVLKIKKR